jgi:hypothetical protein
MRSPVVSPLTRFLIGVPLVLLTTETARFFAWTIDPPMTAAFLGANYWSSALLAILASREDLWANGRIAVSVALAFAPLTTLATLIHLDKFHLDTFFGWFWVVAYSIYPPQLVYFLVKQVRAPGTDPPRERPLPMWVRAILGAHAVIMIPLAVALFVAPGVVDGLWPWTIPPLSARAIAAWVLAFGVLGAHAIVENDAGRVRAAMLGYPFLGAMHVLMLVRFGDDIRWDSAAAWVYVACVASFFVLGAYGLIAEAATGPRPAARWRAGPHTRPSRPVPLRRSGMSRTPDLGFRVALGASRTSRPGARGPRARTCPGQNARSNGREDQVGDEPHPGDRARRRTDCPG